MGMRSPQSEKSQDRTKAIGLAVSASIFAAVATMFVPTAMLEAITGATGLSELVPATAAPLGDKARALIAFAAGGVTMAVALGFLMRKNKISETESEIMASAEPEFRQEYSPESHSENTPLFSQLRRRLGGWKIPKMPWFRSEASNDVYELTDLPELRPQDVHPDTPRRRPISAASDFGDIGLDGKSVYMPDVPFPVQGGSVAFGSGAFAETETAQQAAPSHDDMPFYADRDVEFVPADSDDNVEFVAEFVAPTPPAFAPAPAYAAPETIVTKAPVTGGQPTLAELVQQLEGAAENRRAQLAALEMIAVQMAANAAVKQAEPEVQSMQMQPESQPPAERAEIEIMQPVQRPPLEAVPVSARQKNDDEMDAALNAALATLQRMNAK